MVPVGRPQAIAAVGFYWARTGAVDPSTVAFLEALADAASESITACLARGAAE